MTSSDIYAILASKPHNPHYLKRYWKFIQLSYAAPDEYVEMHHICPKAKDLFPEYNNLRKYKWNQKYLSARQHILAHILLWKAYGGSQTTALFCILSSFNSSTNAFLKNRKIPESIEIRYLAKIREAKGKLTGLQKKNMSTYKDSNGVKYYLHKDSPLIHQLGLTGFRKNSKMSEESKQRFREAKDPYRTIVLKFMDLTRSFNISEGKWVEYLDQGWLPFLCAEDKEYRFYLANIKRSETTKGISRPNNSLQTPARLEAQKKRSKAAVERLTGTKIYNNGIQEIKVKGDPPEGFVKGRLITEEHKQNQKEATSKARRNTKCYNNGLVNIYLKDGQEIPEGFNPGMKPR